MSLGVFAEVFGRLSRGGHRGHDGLGDTLDLCQLGAAHDQVGAVTIVTKERIDYYEGYFYVALTPTQLLLDSNFNIHKLDSGWAVSVT